MPWPVGHQPPADGGQRDSSFTAGAFHSSLSIRAAASPCLCAKPRGVANWYRCGAPELQLKALTTRSQNMTDEVIPDFHNDLGVTVIEIGAKKFMCMGALPPQDHPHVFCDMGADIVCVPLLLDALSPQPSPGA